MFGGEDPWLEGLVPSDIEIRGNDIARPWSWWDQHPDHDGTRWTIKNLLELKNARRVLIQGNRFARSQLGSRRSKASRSCSRRAIRKGARPGRGSRTSRSLTMNSANIDNGVNILAFDDRHPDVTLAEGR